MNLSEVIVDLEKRREHLSITIDVLKAYGVTLGAAPEPPRRLLEAAGDPVSSPPKRKKNKTARSGRPGRKQRDASGTCSTHPDATEFDKHGRCRQCLRDYQKQHRIKKLAELARANGGSRPAPSDPLRDEDLEDPEDEREETAPAPRVARPFMWSKLTRCPKCGETARLRRLADADLAKDTWIHPGPNCTIKIAHYKIKDDPKYVGSDVATPPPPERVICSTCDESFPNDRSLEAHSQRVHFSLRRSELPDDDD
jgi:hypothetical protein